MLQYTALTQFDLHSVHCRHLANLSNESIHFEGVHQFLPSPFLLGNVQHWAQGPKLELNMLQYTALTHFDLHLAQCRCLANLSNEFIRCEQVNSQSAKGLVGAREREQVVPTGSSAPSTVSILDLMPQIPRRYLLQSQFLRSEISSL
jgi:hypothetical protein